MYGIFQVVFVVNNNKQTRLKCLTTTVHKLILKIFTILSICASKIKMSQKSASLKMS